MTIAGAHHEVPEDYDDDDYPSNTNPAMFYQTRQKNSITDGIYEDRFKLQQAGLKETSLSQIGGKKRFRPPTLIIPSFAQPLIPSSPSVSSFHSTSSGGDRSSIYPQQQQQQQQYRPSYYPPPQQQQQQYYPQQYHPQQYQQYLPQNHFQAPIHYNQVQRSGNSLISPPGSSIYLSQGPTKRSQTPSGYDSDHLSLPITPESSEGNVSTEEVIELKQQNEELISTNETLNARISTLEKLLNDKQQELQLKDNIIDAKSKQLNLREEKLNNKDKQIESLNKKINGGGNFSNDELTVTRLEMEKNQLESKINTLLKQKETNKTIDHDRLEQVNKDLTKKIELLIKDNEQLQSQRPQLISSPRVGTSSSRTMKDLSKEELFEQEFLEVISLLSQNKLHYESKINSLQNVVDQHRDMVKNMSQVRKTHRHDGSKGVTRKGLKIIDIVPSTL